MLILHSQAHSSDSNPNHFTPGQNGCAGRASFDAAHKIFGFLGTLLGHVELLAHRHSQVLLPRVAFNPFSPQPVPGITLAEVQDPPYSVCKGQKLGQKKPGHNHCIMENFQHMVEGTPADCFAEAFFSGRKHMETFFSERVNGNFLILSFSLYRAAISTQLWATTSC